MNYIKKLPKQPSFVQNGLKGYQFDLNTKELGFCFIDCFKGHDKYCINKQSTHIYRVLEGDGRFCINGNIYDVTENDVIEIPANTEFVYAGKMKLILIMLPEFKPENSIDTRDNDLY